MAREKRYGSIQEITKDFFPELHRREMEAAEAARRMIPDELTDRADQQEREHRG